MTTAALGGIPFSDGALQIQVRPATGVPSTEPVNGGWAIASIANAAYVEDAGAAVPATAVTLGGLAFTTDGALYITQSTSGTFASIGGHKVRSDGALLVKGGTPTVGTDPYISGWAHDGATQAAYIDGSFVLPLADLGAGAVNTAPLVGGSATFTRATTAWTKLSTGLWASIASGTARSAYLGMTTAVGAYGGYLSEGARTNSCLQSRDLTNASWTKTTLTTAKTSTGIDGVTNSCTRCTASAGNGQATQAIVLASAAKTFSVWIKRVTGTGIVQISLDNFATNTDVTALINSSTFTLVQMAQTLANPTVGIRLVTNTDAIDVDVAQLEDGVIIASTPIPTTTIAVTRNADLLTYTLSGNFDGTAGSVYAEMTTAQRNAQAYVFGSNSNKGMLSGGQATDHWSLFDGTTQDGNSSNFSYPVTSVTKVSASWGGSSKNTFISGVAGVTPGVFDGDMSFVTSFSVGGVSNAEINGTIKNFRLWIRKLSDAALIAQTS